SLGRRPAVTADSTTAVDTSSGSPDRFGYSWARFADLSLEQFEQFRRWTCLLDPDTDWRGRSFLDVGCGAGRNSYWAMSLGATGGAAIDVNESSLRAARRNLAAFADVRVEFRSVYDLEYENAFDIVFSIGVIHHLEHPELALQRMRRAAKPGG